MKKKNTANLMIRSGLVIAALAGVLVLRHNIISTEQSKTGIETAFAQTETQAQPAAQPETAAHGQAQAAAQTVATPQPQPETQPQTEAPQQETQPQTEAPQPETQPQTEAPQQAVMSGSAGTSGFTISLGQVSGNSITLNYTNEGNVIALGWVNHADAVAVTDQGTYYCTVNRTPFDKIQKGESGSIVLNFNSPIEGTLTSVALENVNVLDNRGLPIGFDGGETLTIQVSYV